MDSPPEVDKLAYRFGVAMIARLPNAHISVILLGIT